MRRGFWQCVGHEGQGDAGSIAMSSGIVGCGIAPDCVVCENAEDRRPKGRAVVNASASAAYASHCAAFATRRRDTTVVVLGARDSVDVTLDRFACSPQSFLGAQSSRRGRPQRGILIIRTGLRLRMCRCWPRIRVAAIRDRRVHRDIVFLCRSSRNPRTSQRRCEGWRRWSRMPGGDEGRIARERRGCSAPVVDGVVVDIDV